MENFFNQYPYALFFIGCFFLLVENKEIKKTTNSNIIVLYYFCNNMYIFCWQLLEK